MLFPDRTPFAIEKIERIRRSVASETNGLRVDTLAQRLLDPLGESLDEDRKSRTRWLWLERHLLRKQISFCP